jgi:hypothetical protein
MRVLLVAAVLTLAVGCEKVGAEKGSGGFAAPDDWTHRELVAHLTKKGVDVRHMDAPELSRDGKTAALLYQKPDGASAASAAVVAYLCRDRSAARERAGAMGGDAFTAGRFAIGRHPSLDRPADAALLNEIRAALSQ